jgi:hypothetical protein
MNTWLFQARMHWWKPCIGMMVPSSWADFSWRLLPHELQLRRVCYLRFADHGVINSVITFKAAQFPLSGKIVGDHETREWECGKKPNLTVYSLIHMLNLHVVSFMIWGSSRTINRLNSQLKLGPSDNGNNTYWSKMGSREQCQFSD